jgi:hypothetical protein
VLYIVEDEIISCIPNGPSHQYGYHHEEPWIGLSSNSFYGLWEGYFIIQIYMSQVPTVFGERTSVQVMSYFFYLILEKDTIIGF